MIRLYTCLLPLRAITYLISLVLVLQANNTLAQITCYVSSTGTNSTPSTATSWATSTNNLQGAINYVANSGGGTVYVASGVYKPGGLANTNQSTNFSMANNVTIIGGYEGVGAPGNRSTSPSSSTLSGEIGDPTRTDDNSYSIIRNAQGQDSSAVLDGFVLTGGIGIGGGMRNISASPTVINCSFIDNPCQSGAMHNTSSSNPIVTNCSFSGNLDGGIQNQMSSSPIITNCSFSNNTSNNGAGINNLSSSNPTVINCRFINNAGKGIHVQAHLTLINSTFIGNTATFGAAITINGSDASATITNCSFFDNSATNGIIYVYSTRPNVVLTNCSFFNNSSPSGLIYNLNRSTASLTNCIIWGNQVTNKLAISPIQVDYSLIGPSAITGYTGTDNLISSLFPFMSSSDLRLNSCSPAINAGLNSVTALNGITTDLAGNARIYNETVDMGAYEFEGISNAVSITNPTLTTATMGQAFSQRFTANGGSGPYSFSVSSSSLPASLSLSSTGELSGTPTQPGSYTLTVLAQNANSCQATSDVYRLIVYPTNPTISGFTVSSSSVCAGTTVSFSATVGNVTGSYAYTLTSDSSTTSGTSSTTALSLNHTITGAGNQSYTLIVTDNGLSSTATTSVFGNSLPTASLQASGTLTCSITSVTLTAGGGTTYAFSGSGMINQDPTSGQAVVNAAGLYSVTATSSAGCSATNTTSVSSNTVLSISTGSSLPQANVGVVVSLTATGATHYQWSAPGSASLTSPATNSVVSAKLTTPGVQTFTVIASSGVCSQSALVSVTALAGPDLSAIMSLPNSNFSNGETKVLLMQVQEVNGSLATGNIVVTLTVPTGYSVNFDNTQSSVVASGESPIQVSVDNPQWHQISNVAGQQISITLNSGQSVGANTTMNLGFTITRTTANSGSVANITVNVADDSSGSYDVNRLNNVYARIITGL